MSSPLHPPCPPGKTFCEFFAGIGLVREALSGSGWACVFSNDIDPKKYDLYAARFGSDGAFHLGDIRETATIAAKVPGRPFLATASFPCIDLSLAGHWRGVDGAHSSAVFGFADVLAALGPRSPTIVLLENVVGFMSSHGGEDFRRVARTLAGLGYWLDAFVVDAKAFVPQSRPRVFLLAVHRDADPAGLAGAEPTLFGHETVFDRSPRAVRPDRLLALMRSTRLPTGWAVFPLPAPTPARRSLESVIDLDDAQDWWDRPAVDKHLAMMTPRHRELVDRWAVAADTHVATIFRRKRHGATRAEVRADGLAGCLRTPRGGSARQIVVAVTAGEVRMRWMSPREYARLQGADDFPLVANTNQNLLGFGDAVCVPVVRWIDEQLLTPIHDRVSGDGAPRVRRRA